MELYFFKSVACLAIFLAFYKLFLERESMHLFKRFYLLLSLLAAIVIPYITFTTYVEPSSGNLNSILMPAETPAELIAEKTNHLPYILGGIYAFGVLFFSIKFIRNLRVLILKIRNNPKVKRSRFTNVLLSEKIQPHTFFSYIFFNREKFMHHQIPEDVIVHEEAHARQRHSLDVLFVELLQIIFWINPFIFLLKKAIKLNHEFLADRAVIRRGICTAGYQQTLLSFSSKDLQSGLVNPINYSSIKTRFKVMKTQTSKTAVWTRSLVVLPLLAMLVYGFSTRNVLEKELISPELKSDMGPILELTIDSEGAILRSNNEISIEEVKKLNGKNFSGFAISVSPNAPKALLDGLVKTLSGMGISGTVGICTTAEVQEKATPEMVAEYNKLVKYYNSLSQQPPVVKQEDANRIMYIYSLMTPEQKRNAEKIKFDVPPPPPPAPVVEVTGYPTPRTPVKDSGEQKAPPVPPVPTKEDLPPPPPPVEVTGYPTPPPPPPPIKFEDLVADGAIFYYNGKEIEPEKARDLVEVQKSVNIHITTTDDDKPVVRLTDKKEKK